MTEATLYINSSDSRCGACNKGCSPYEKAHKMRLGYGDHDGVGCGATFTALSSDYVGRNIKSTCMEMRPDLPWVGLEDIPAVPS